MDWQYGVGMFFISLFFLSFFFNVLLSFVLAPFSIHSRILTFAHLVVLRGSVIACRSIQRHIMAMKSDIDIYKSILLMREPEQEHTSQHVAPQWWSVFAPPSRKMAKRNFDLLCA